MYDVYVSTISILPARTNIQATPLNWSHEIDSILLSTILLPIWQPEINDQQVNKTKGKKYKNPVAQPSMKGVQGQN